MKRIVQYQYHIIVSVHILAISEVKCDSISDEGRNWLRTIAAST